MIARIAKFFIAKGPLAYLSYLQKQNQVQRPNLLDFAGCTM